ncbi:hypothetical protein NUU61_004864 [Penicillium alfredii]|uniref:DUF7820 domain-containing protein n=1 Tax=Penicillium alfredii TaxID=1506179 RepID=A0A9W9F8D4_9EURO|nr:uncharacterized protein NUU61_004864 [Penicillium alfredii]KAJ5095508.1 hypothetical protein NUU61_004864 [Penicillium alfredii]
MPGHISSEHSRSASRSSQTPRLSQGQAVDAMPRHSFGRSSRASNPNVFSDEYSLEAIDPDRIERAPSPSSIASSTTLRSNQQQPKTFNTVTADNENPFADEARVSLEEAHRSSLPQKGAGFSANRNSIASTTTTPSMIQRNQSISSRFSMPRALSPYTGATGPSHPYAMYPQVGVSRSPSVGSSSTIRQADRPLGETSGPQHPYAMYPQNVVEEGMDDTAIPLGFPGHNPPYQPPVGRRDDDVGDIIGPDGHTEPLPPYSRYPTGAVPKPSGAEAMADTTTASDEHQLNPASGDPPVSEVSSRALVPEAVPSHERGADEPAPTTGVMAFEEKLKRKGKQTACCGLPVWTLVLVGTVMLIGGCIGGVIGGVLGTKKAADSEKTEQSPSTQGPPVRTVTTSPQLDASLMTTTPPNLKTVPTGHFMIPSVVHNSSDFCIDDHHYRRAWACQNEPKDFEVHIGGREGHHSIIFANNGPSPTFTYGAQEPLLPHPTQSLSMAVDTSDVGMGPALFFFALFDKLVIVPEETFSSNSLSGRSFFKDNKMVGDLRNRKQTAQPGERPWFCWWNSTTLEFFMYVNQSSANNGDSSTAATDSNMAAITAGSHSNSKRGDPTLDYPRRIKMEERRDYADAEAPYCQQMQVMENNKIGVLSGEMFNVKEIEPTPTTTYVNHDDSSQTYTARAHYASACYCQSLTD